MTETPNDAEQKKQQTSSDDNFTVVEGTVRIAPPVIGDAPLVPGTCDLGGSVEVEATGGTNAAYATLGAAFAAINAGTHTITGISSTTEFIKRLPEHLPDWL